MGEYNLLYQLKDLEKNLVIFITKDKSVCDEYPPPTPTQIRIVDYILKHDKNNIYQKDLEKNLDLTRATLSGVLKTMEKNSIINRVISDNDARSKRIILSDKIVNKFKESSQRMHIAEDTLLKNLTNDEINTFRDVLIKMNNNIRIYNIENERNDINDKINEKF